MTAEEALKTIEHALDRGYLNQVEEIVFRAVWEGRSYLQIAQASGYDYGYIKDTGYKLWRSLSDAYDEKITKHNVKGTIQREVRKPLRIAKSKSQQSMDLSPSPNQNWEYSNTSWGDAIDVSIFYDRTQELTKLQQWVVCDRCRLVTLLGESGIGKTALSVKLAQLVKPEFQFVIWRSLRDAPALTELLTDLIQLLAPNTDIPATVGGQLSRLIYCLRESRCLIVLDHFDMLLTGRSQSNQYQLGYEAYGELLRRVAEIPHQSCIVLTSRAKPAEVAAFEGERLAVRSLHVAGLTPAAAAQILAAKGLQGTPAEIATIVAHYEGNPLALKIAASSVLDLSNGSIKNYLGEQILNLQTA
ncbi:NACHT domain-containing protein [Cyanobacteria bacterium FACHB-63]|nr:NACHT domain-containing protein [Cyanobacteria bacterium FACHB-63]